jgi:hypothetical protein
MTDRDAASKSHNDLYLAVRRLEAIIHRERAAHPRTKVWKDLEQITQTIGEIQKDWFQTHGR